MMEKKRLLFCFLMAMLMPFFMMPVAARTSTAQFSLHDTRGQLSESPVFSKAAPNPDDERPAAAPASDNKSIPVVKLNADSTTLTFTYAAASTVDTTTTYPLSWMNNSDKACRDKVKKAVFDHSFSEARPTSTAYWFSQFTQLQTIEGLEYLNTSEVTNMNRMFYGCSSLTSLDLSSFNTSNVTDMSSMFYGCSDLTSLDLSSFNTSNVTDMGSMFGYCTSLTSLDLSNFNTGNVTSMTSMFSGCKSLTSLDLNNLNTSEVTKMNEMFRGCSSLTSLDLSSFNTSKVTDMNDMFVDCSSLTTLELSSFNTSNVTDMCYMFAACSSLTSLDLSNFNTNKVTNIYEMFGSCSNLRKINLGNNDFKNVIQQDNALKGVGTSENPCMLKTAPDFDKSVLGELHTGTTNYYSWLGGYVSQSSASIVSQLDNTIYINDTIAHSDKQLKLSIRMKNTEKILGLQFDLHLPDGFSVDQSANGKYNLTVSTARDADESLDYHPSNMISKNVYRAIAVSTQHVTIAPGDDEVLTLVLNVDKSVADGEHILTLDSIVLVKDDLGSIDLDSITLNSVVTTYSYVMGDVNDNGKIDVQDIAILADYILKKNPEDFVLLAADMNDDGKFDVADLAAIADQILQSSSKAKAIHKAAPRKAEGNVPGIVADYDNIIYLNDVQATAGEKLALKMRLKNTEKILGLQFDLRLPDGFTVDQSENGKYNLTVSTARDADESLDYHPSNMISKNVYRAIAVSTQHVTIAPGDDEVLTLVLNVDKSVAPGEYVFALDSIVLVKDDLGSIDLSGTTFQSAVTVVAAFDGVVLDEDSATPPTKSDGPVNVKVLRTMNGGEWATLCLPFAMTGEQVKTVFGDDVQLADYAGWEPFYASDEDELPSTITVSFNRLDADNGIVANHPYVIKPSAGITAFVADNVTIEPKNNPSVSTGSNRQHNLGSFTGTYVADFTVPQASLFISGDKFWYSVGKTRMKAFRAYFEFTDVLASYYDGSAAKVNFTLNDATGIDNASVRPTAASGRVYTLGGQLVSTRGTGRLPKGIYIVDGKKIAVK